MFTAYELNGALKHNLRIADISIMPSNTEIRLTFYSGQTFVTAIKDIGVINHNDDGNNFKIACLIDGKTLSCTVDLKGGKHDFYHPELLLAIISPKV